MQPAMEVLQGTERICLQERLGGSENACFRCVSARFRCVPLFPAKREAFAAKEWKSRVAGQILK
jgi:hypothetical protein